MDMPQDPSMMEEPEGVEPTAPTQGGLCVELKIGADGSLKIGVEPLEMEEEEGTEEEYQTVPNLAAAFKLIKEIVSQGQMVDPAAGQTDMASGYGK